LQSAAAMLRPQADDARRFYLRDGDRVVFYGDSITEQRLYSTFVETFVLTRFPTMNVRFMHSGWGGDRVTGGGGGPIDVRLTRDVIAHSPTVVTIMLGMNDASYKPFNETLLQQYLRGYEQIIQQLRKSLPGVRISVLQPSAYDDVTRSPLFDGGYNAVLLRYGQAVAEIAQRYSLQLVDLNTPLLQLLKSARAADPSLSQRLIPDRVHPAPGAHLIMAAALLKAWTAPPFVSMSDIDAVGKRVRATTNAAVSDLQETATGFSWDQEDQALPMPVDLKDPVTALAVNSSDFVDALNRQIVRVRGLRPGRYTLRISGENVATHSHSDWDQGVNIAMLDTPMARTAAEVHALTVKHNNVYFARWRQIQLLEPAGSERIQPALDAMDTLQALYMRDQRTKALPQSRRYEIMGRFV
jgi:lysophospholipase L1-like esterase